MFGRPRTGVTPLSGRQAGRTRRHASRVWSGGTLTVDSTGVLKGEINADTAQSGGVNCCSWIDLFALGDIQIKGDTTGVFAVHANQLVLNTSFGGYITVKSTGGNVTATGLAIQANATQSGGTGGIVTIEAKGDVTLDEAQIHAKGDTAAGGGFGTGGTVGGPRVQRHPELGESPGWRLGDR